MIGILLGLVLGLGVVIAFVFYGSEETIDAPRISNVDAGGQGGLPFEGAATLPLVRVVGGRPPPSGPPRLDFRAGRTARFLVDSDRPIRIVVQGYGVSRTVQAGRSTISFEADEPGQYAVLTAPSQIQVAAMRVRRR